MNCSELRAWHKDKKAEEMLKNLKNRKIKAFYAQTREEAKKIIYAEIPEGKTIALSGSQTMEELGIYSELRANKKDLLVDPDKGKNTEENFKIRKEMLLADVFLTGTNAIDSTGILYNIDGLGNRVAAMIWGPDKVIIAVTLNKIVDGGADEAWKRIANIAAPINSKRLKRKTPCVETGLCQDCKSPDRICNYYTAIKYSVIPERIVVVLINDDNLGY